MHTWFSRASKTLTASCHWPVLPCTSIRMLYVTRLGVHPSLSSWL